MATTYEYGTLAEIENLIGLDLSAIDSTAFSDARVEAMITLAERMVNGYLGVTTAQTVTDGIKTATLMISMKMISGKLRMLGYLEEAEYLTQFVDLTIKQIYEFFLAGDSDVDAIPMSGANDDMVGHSGFWYT
jgi:hypothetical protein